MAAAISKKLAFSGALAPSWLFAGVAITSSLYPGYSQYNQMLSELGAIGSPTRLISPLINNFPLAVLFTVFGIFLCVKFRSSGAAVASGILIIIHGIGTFVAGLFPCDIGCKMESPSHSQIIHSTAGGVMFLSLTVANLIWARIGNRQFNSGWFSGFSSACAVLSLIAFGFLLFADKLGGVGLYQRLNYGFSLIWLFTLALMTTRKTTSATLAPHTGKI